MFESYFLEFENYLQLLGHKILSHLKTEFEIYLQLLEHKILSHLMTELEIEFELKLAMGPGWELPSHQDLVSSRSRSWLGMGPGAPIL